MKDTKAFVESLFDGYEKTPALVEFMEELTGNFDDKVASGVKKGMSREAAFGKAQAELGDISAFAAELSLKARQDVYAERYLGIRSYMTATRAALYVLCGAFLAFGLVSAAIVYFTAVADAYGASTNSTERMTEVFGVLLIFLTASAAGFTFLGLTQETADYRPMRKKRAALYAAASGLIVFGCAFSPLTYFATGRGLMEASAVLIPFFLPGAGGLAFLVLTEKSRLKPWAARDTALAASGGQSSAQP
ncbi:MAG: permease prefix domain 1-containing protein [Spirochaetaceae bacterium]|nr:permease prefix domain 1-containing protein [Spirochaetaceae bacterium]